MADNSNGHKPEFDFEDLSWGDMGNFSVLQARIQKATANQDVDELRALNVEIDQFVARVLISVPSDWVRRSDRDKVIDWSNYENIRGCIRGDKVMAIMKALATAMSTDEVTKN